MVLIPCLALIVINLTLLIFAIRAAQRKVNKMNILIVIMVTLAFVVTFTPFAVQYLRYGENFNTASRAVRTGQLICVISSFCNPFIYLATNDKFRSFTRSSLGGVCGEVSCYRGWASLGGSFREMLSRLRPTLSTNYSRGSGGATAASAGEGARQDTTVPNTVTSEREDNVLSNSRLIGGVNTVGVAERVTVTMTGNAEAEKKAGNLSLKQGE
jgi:hypothetical protein